jgi:hypothetical protein
VGLSLAHLEGAVHIILRHTELQGAPRTHRARRQLQNAPTADSYLVVLEMRHTPSSLQRWQREDRSESSDPGDFVISRTALRISIRVNGGEPAGIAAARQSMQIALPGYSLWSSRPMSARTNLSTTSSSSRPLSRGRALPADAQAGQRGPPGHRSGLLCGVRHASMAEHRTCQPSPSRKCAKRNARLNGHRQVAVRLRGISYRAVLGRHETGSSIPDQWPAFRSQANSPKANKPIGASPRALGACIRMFSFREAQAWNHRLLHGNRRGCRDSRAPKLSGVRGTVGDLVDEFTNAYLAAYPKKH